MSGSLSEHLISFVLVSLPALIDYQISKSTEFALQWHTSEPQGIMAD